MREWGFDDEVRHDIQRSVVGKESLTDFTEAEGQELLNHLVGATQRVAPTGGDARIRKRWTRPDGITEIYATPTVTHAQIRMLYALMHRIAELESESARASRHGGTAPSQQDGGSTDALRARLDGWARKMSNGEASQLTELMKDEASNLIEALKHHVERLGSELDI